MRIPQTWCTDQQAEHHKLSELVNNEAEAASQSTQATSLSSRIQEEKALGARLNSLPPEVLSEIFYWCAPTADDQESCDPHMALRLSHVCKHWREVTLHSPKLWTYTKIKIIQESIEPALELMTIYLERSKSRAIFIDFDFVDVWSYYRSVLDLFELLVNKAREYRPPESIADSFLATHLEASSTEERPTREEWYFWSARPEASSQTLEDNTVSDMQLANTPARNSPTESLVTLRALRIAVGSFVLEPYLSWSSSLTFLILKDMHDFTNLSVSEAMRILSSFPLLVHCSIHIDYESVEHQAFEPNSIQLQFLQSFSMSWLDWIDAGPLLDALHAPSLRELELTGRLPEVEGGGEWRHLVQFLQQNKSPISHLIFESIDCFHIDFLSALAFTPTLEGLWLEDCLLDDTIIRGLVPVLGPNGLKSLVLLECYAFDIEVLARVLKDSEQAGSVPVKVYVDGVGDLAPKHMSMIREMGLDNLEIGPSSTPVDLDTTEIEEQMESRVEVVEDA
ncbi:uncharacterized protein FOMMEDRAFT_153684 [Fomitiporia mediterranea MF3/22]|uniref:uncharacterized protein n=1 Tax=Fomitiporia mediterranea (strain MF3/22) TaxID=694068 RepID=UPI00044088BE|nr:uncharacterized protein FOMMEDRAFT_153684 [Fomitiporia mediterranea MF3/22]EJD06277.1 hypothetical protein FOMMEDRAFT_153684 [Fomitiporia mediterranea MF3/22]